MLNAETTSSEKLNLLGPAGSAVASSIRYMYDKMKSARKEI